MFENTSTSPFRICHGDIENETGFGARMICNLTEPVNVNSCNHDVFAMYCNKCMRMETI